MPPSSVRCSHLLIKHTGSRNPVSRRTGAQITCSKDEAYAELATIRERVAPVSLGEYDRQLVPGSGLRVVVVIRD